MSFGIQVLGAGFQVPGARFVGQVRGPGSWAERTYEHRQEERNDHVRFNQILELR